VRCSFRRRDGGGAEFSEHSADALLDVVHRGFLHAISKLPAAILREHPRPAASGLAAESRPRRAAELLRKEKDLGSVTPGKFADVVAVSGNPLDDIGLMRKVTFVMKDAVVYKRDGKATSIDGL
jgi:hypothetical protein